MRKTLIISGLFRNILIELEEKEQRIYLLSNKGGDY